MQPKLRCLILTVFFILLIFISGCSEIAKNNSNLGNNQCGKGLSKCGSNCYNSTTQSCCQEKIYNGRYWAECNGTCYNYATDTCCNGQIYNSTIYICCGYTVTNRDQFYCCGKSGQDICQKGQSEIQKPTYSVPPTITSSGLNYRTSNLGEDVRLYSTKMSVDLIINVKSADISKDDIVTVTYSIYNNGETEFAKWRYLKNWFEGESYSDDYSDFKSIPKKEGNILKGINIQISTYIPQAKVKGTIFHISLKNETEVAWKIT